MSDTRNHTTRDQLAEVVADAICGRGDRPSYSPDQPCRAHLMQAEAAADALLASDAIAAVRAAAVAETTAAIEAVRDVLLSIDAEYHAGDRPTNAVTAVSVAGRLRAALSGGRTALDTTLAQARAEAVELAAQDFPLTPNITLTGVRICEMLHARAARLRADTGADQ